MSFDEMKSRLFQLGFAPFFKNKGHYKLESQVFSKASKIKEEADKGEELFKNIWEYANPTGNEAVSVVDVFELVRILSSNANNDPSTKAEGLVASFLVKLLEREGIPTKPKPPPANDGEPIIQIEGDSE